MLLISLFVPPLIALGPDVNHELLQMRLGRLELPRPRTHVPETCASTNSATTALRSPDGHLETIQHSLSRPQTGFYQQLPVLPLGTKVPVSCRLTGIGSPRTLATTRVLTTR